MEFLVTTFLYPLSEPIVLSKKLGFSLDNPRTEYEIEGIRSYLLCAYESGYDYKFPICSDEPIVTLESILLQFRDTLSKEDTYVEQMFVHYEQAKIFDFLAKIWVIARFEDEGIGETLRSEHRRMLEEGTHGFFMLEDDHPLVKNVENLANYCYLLSLLMHTEKESYFGRTFLIDPKTIDSNRPIQKVWQEYFMFGVASHSYPQSQDELRWIFLPYIRQSIIHLSQLLEQAFEEGLTEKLLYIGSILKIVGHDISDIKTRIVMLTSIIELLLTHNPDFSRFNVEDSINKQFQLKASILIYLNDKTIDINLVKSRLKTIYQQRSNIAHGNFMAVDKYIRNLSKREGMEEYFDDLVVDLYRYIRAILEEFLKDSNFIIFLKEN